MAKHFHPGQRIRCRGEEWQVTGAQKWEVANGDTVWEVRAIGLNRIVQGFEFSFLDDIDDIEILDPTDIEPVLATPRKAKLYWEANLRRLLPRNGAIYLGLHGAVKPYEYQLRPAAQALNLMRPRILIGDAVGLGKTIECGILLSELMRRGKGKRVLCAVPKAILEQFQNEMWGRFAIPFHRLDSKGLERLRQELPSTMNPFFHFDKAIISIDTLKLKKYQKLLEDCSWDVLIIDECHNVADRTDGGGGSARHRVAKRLAENSNAVILMSATPHDGTKPGFASLIKLLDRTKIKRDEDYSAEDFKDHFIRRSRSTVAAELSHREERKQAITEIPLSEVETNILQSLHDADTRSNLVSKRSGRGCQELFKTTLIKSFLSSPQALLQTVTEKRKRINKALESGKRKPDAETEKFITLLEDIETDITALPVFSRLNALSDYLRKHPTSDDDRVVIFTERLKTLEAIKEHLIAKKLADGIFDTKLETQADSGRLIATALGSMSDTELNRVVKAFQSRRDGVHILVATNVASEGLNLHKHCHRLIHFDLPWSLITLEQRNGRIDRLGQTKCPQIFYFASTVEKDTREAKATALKDDFWIIEKIQRRIEIASTDMAEEAQSKFVTGDMEEQANTEAYENKKLNVDSHDSLLALLGGDGNLEAWAQVNIETRKLPTLYDKSPADFIREISKETGIEIEESQNDRITIGLGKTLKFEVQSWPAEFRPTTEDPTITFDGNPERMQSHYEQAMDQGAYLEQAFLNEIHPAIALMENTALSLFPGKHIPTVAIKGETAGSVYFLVQATLFNQRNDVTNQYWQVFEHKRGSTKVNPIVNIEEKTHALDACQWLTQSIKKVKQKKELTDHEKKRISSLTTKSIELMAEQVSECRKSRARELLPILKSELARIKSWEEDRDAYLKSIIAPDGNKEAHAGVYALESKARHELQSLDSDSKKYNDFIQEYLTTSNNPDIRILGCFIVGE